MTANAARIPPNAREPQSPMKILAVCIQVISFKTRGKRVFKMAPIHHHFEMCGWSENKVVVTFWAVGFIAGIIGLLLGVL